MSYHEMPVRRINRYEGVVVSVRVDQARLSDGRLTLRHLDGTPLQRLRVFGGDDET